MQQRRQARPPDLHRTGQLASEHMSGLDALGGQRRELCIEVLTTSAHPRVPEDCRHTLTVSSTSDVGDLRHAV